MPAFNLIYSFKRTIMHFIKQEKYCTQKYTQVWQYFICNIQPVVTHCTITDESTSALACTTNFIMLTVIINWFVWAEYYPDTLYIHAVSHRAVPTNWCWYSCIRLMKSLWRAIVSAVYLTMTSSPSRSIICATVEMGRRHHVACEWKKGKVYAPIISRPDYNLHW